MKEIKKYTDVIRYGKASTQGVIQEGDIISITEKVDGANASFTRDEENSIGISCYSRKLLLDEHNTLQGFYGWVEENIAPIKYKLFPNFRYIGEWLCLSGDTVIKKTSAGKKNGNNMTLREMYEYSVTPLKNRNESQWDKEGYPNIYSLYINEDKIKPNKIAKIIYSGDKEVYRVTTRKGFEIKSTLDHRFWTNKGWKHLKDIEIGDVVGVTKLLKDRSVRRYGKGSRKIKEMFEQIKNERDCEICGCKVCKEIHHKDFDYTNNKLNNLQVLCKDCHSKSHTGLYDNSTRNKEYDYDFDKVMSIEYIGVEDCYDISMEGDENEANFIANGFVVHNCPHKIQYKEEYTKTFLLFSIWDDEKEEYLSDEIVIAEAKRLGLKTVEYFYYGKFISYEHMSSFIGKSNITKDPNMGEGIVVKNVNYKDRYGNQCFVKLVSEKFAEVQKQKLPKNPNINSKEVELIKSILTKPRVDKLMHKLVDENLLSKEDFCIESMGKLLKLLGGRVKEDMIKEESELLNNIEDKVLCKQIGKILPLVLKEVIKEY